MEFNTIDSSQYKISEVLNTKFKKEAQVHQFIINLENEDYTSSGITDGRARYGSQLIFVDKTWALANLNYIGYLYPTSMLVRIESYINNFICLGNQELKSHIDKLSKICFLLLPIADINFYNRSLNIVGLKLKSVTLHPDNLLVEALFLFGIHITDLSIKNLVNTFQLKFPGLNIVNLLANSIESYITSEERHTVRPLGNFKIISRIRKMDSNTIPANLNHWLFKNESGLNHARRYNSYNSYSEGYYRLNYFTIILMHLLWAVRNELALQIISEDLDVIE